MRNINLPQLHETLFGENVLDGRKTELEVCSDNILVIYSDGSIKQSGIYEQVMSILHTVGKILAEISDIMANSTVEKLHEGAAIVRAARADILLAVGRGSMCDYFKTALTSINCDDDPWGGGR